MQDMGFECAVHPADLKLTASLGNVTVIDASLPEGNPYRLAAQPRSGGSTSLIQVHSKSWLALPTSQYKVRQDRCSNFLTAVHLIEATDFWTCKRLQISKSTAMLSQTGQTQSSGIAHS